MGTELLVIAPAAVIAEERISGSDVVAVKTVLHRTSMSGTRGPSFGRCQTGDQKPSRFTASKVLNQKILIFQGIILFRLKMRWILNVLKNIMILMIQ